MQTATSARGRAIASESRQIEASQQRAIAAQAANPPRPRNALEAMATRLDVTPGALKDTLMKTAFKGCSEAEFIGLVIVSNEYELNPMLREIYAFPKKGGGIQAIVGYDGWIKIANRHEQYDGYESEHLLDTDGKIIAAEGIVYRKDRNHPTKKMIYLKEFKRNTDPWNNAPSHMLDVRCFCHTVRLALGISLGVEGDEQTVDGGALVAQQVSLPSTQTMGEQLNDEIPTFDDEPVNEETGELPQRDSRGMSEVDEDTARQLDAGNDGAFSAENPNAREGRDDSQMGEQHANGDEPEASYLPAVRELRSKLAAAKSVRAVEGIDRDWCNGLRDSVEQGDPNLMRGIDRDIADKKRKLQAGEPK